MVSLKMMLKVLSKVHEASTRRNNSLTVNMLQACSILFLDLRPSLGSWRQGWAFGDSLDLMIVCTSRILHWRSVIIQ
jgi:hypothetical protein